MGAAQGLGVGGHHRASSRNSSYPGPGTSDEWITPKWLLDRLGPFDLDPCASKVRPWPTAKRHLTVDDDGLSRPWKGRVWCNPPYGRATADWLEAAAQHGNTMVLLFARTETEMFHRHVWPHALSVLFLRGRISFYRPDGTKKGNAGGPSVLIAYGAPNDYALRHSAIPGVFLSLRAAAAVNGLKFFAGRCTRTEMGTA